MNCLNEQCEKCPIPTYNTLELEIEKIDRMLKSS